MKRKHCINCGAFLFIININNSYFKHKTLKKAKKHCIIFVCCNIIRIFEYTKTDKHYEESKNNDRRN